MNGNLERRVVYLETPSGSRKISGYLRACGECGQDELLYFCDGTAEGGADVTEKLLAEHPETDAVVYAFDLMAVSGSRRILDAGRRIPDDIAVMGTDNSPFSSLANPRLSTIDTRLQELSSEVRTMIFYESPYRLVKTLDQFAEVFGPERMCSVAREISKKFEEHRRGPVKEVADWYREHEPKGEIVIILAGASTRSE